MRPSLVSGISVSQGSVATHMRCSEIVNKRLAANILQILTVTDFENRLTTNRVAAVSLVSTFLEHGVLAEARVVSQEGAL